jgi:hypothetical protein
MVAADGTATWSEEIELDQEPTDGKSMLATFVTSSGQTLGTHTAHFYPYDHLPGGVLVVPAAPQPSGQNSFVAKARLASAWSTVRVAGVTNTLAH